MRVDLDLHIGFSGTASEVPMLPGSRRACQGEAGGMTPISGGTTAMNPYAACSSCATSGTPWLRGRSVTDGGTACVMEHWKERKTIAQRLLVCLNTVDSLGPVYHNIIGGIQLI